jgi:hypothetical protein
VGSAQTGDSNSGVAPALAVLRPLFPVVAIGAPNQHLEAYAVERDLAREAVRASIARGENPAREALAVSEALKSRSPRRRYTAGREAKILRLLKKFAPAQLLDRGVRKQFGLEAV